jgi:hypothetical protein
MGDTGEMSWSSTISPEFSPFTNIGDSPIGVVSTYYSERDKGQSISCSRSSTIRFEVILASIIRSSP